MVVWVFAGGGEAEVAGLINFLRKNFNNSCRFERRTPIKNKRGKPNRESYGRTGESLVSQIKDKLKEALRDEPDKCKLILVFDDLDCRDALVQKKKFSDAINETLNQFNLRNQIPILIAFAAPELEAWIIADWDNSVAKHTNFRKRQERMRWWLATQCHIPFDKPESFSQYDQQKDSCREKLSDYLIESTIRQDPTNVGGHRFSKSNDTPQLLFMIDPQIVKQKCPLFREFCNALVYFCQRD